MYPIDKVRCKQCGKNKPANNYQWVSRGTKKGKMQENLVLNSKTCRGCTTQNAKVLYKLKKHHPKPTDCKCESCGKVTDRLHLDHNHQTDKFRGWLCSECNVGLGKIGDDIQSVVKILKYLTKTKTDEEKSKILKDIEKAI